MAPLRIVALEGDQTGQELLEQSLRLLDPELLGFELEVIRFDLSLENRRATRNGVCAEAAEAMKETGLGLKAATITPEGADDVGSPNRLLREAIDGKVILRTGRRIPGVTPVGGVHHPISVCRMAVGDAYGAEERRERDGDDELALRTERIRRSDCRAVAEYSFREAERIGGRVYGGPKWTVSPVYEGMLKEEMDAASERHPGVAYEPVLIDATLAGLVGGAADDSLVIPCLNRDGDLLSDLVLPLFGSIAGAESILLALDAELAPSVAMAEAPHGTAPALEGKDLANPMAMILACAALLHYAGDVTASAEQTSAAADREAEVASRAIYESVFETVAAGTRTPDLGGHAGTTEFTDAVIALVRRKLDAWSSLGGPN
ncbi:MAG: isocitrate/isopropylmalate dehydrogenase [Solirubrobacterales bacterium]|jgi:isocitrate/isopropylmalate dehydrogenase|nr:isocitrate/isopropylmalate dehydrogenase [Solirubrobacterales bacterium]